MNFDCIMYFQFISILHTHSTHQQPSTQPTLRCYQLHPEDHGTTGPPGDPWSLPCVGAFGWHRTTPIRQQPRWTLDPRTADGRGETNRIGAMARDFVIRTVNGRLNFRKAYLDVTLHAQWLCVLDGVPVGWCDFTRSNFTLMPFC